MRDDIPEFIRIYLIVIVHKDVTKADNAFPGSIGMILLKCWRQHIGRLADYFQILYNSVK